MSGARLRLSARHGAASGGAEFPAPLIGLVTLSFPLLSPARLRKWQVWQLQVLAVTPVLVCQADKKRGELAAE